MTDYANTGANKALHPTRWGFGVALSGRRLPGAGTPHASRGLQCGLAAWAAPAPRLTPSFELAAAPPRG